MKKRYRVPVICEAMGYLHVEADTAEEAMRIIREAQKLPVPEDLECLPETLKIDEEGEEVIDE